MSKKFSVEMLPSLTQNLIAIQARNYWRGAVRSREMLKIRQLLLGRESFQVCRTASHRKKEFNSLVTRTGVYYVCGKELEGGCLG